MYRQTLSEEDIPGICFVSESLADALVECVREGGWNREPERAEGWP